MNYIQANETLTGRCRDARKVANNTYLQRREAGAIAIKLHATDVVTYHPNGAITMTSGGWKTITTKDRINRYLPNRFYISQTQGVWALHDREAYKSVPFVDGMTIGPRGGLPKGKSQTRELALIKRINTYAKAYTKALLAGKVAVPSAGDCWGCCMRNDDGQTVMGTSHLIEHMKDKYYVPSLLINAGTEVHTAPVVKGFIYEAMKGGNIEGWGADILNRDVPAMIRKYMKRQLGLAS